MKNPFIIHDSLTNKISFYHICLFVASLPFDRFYSEIILISFTIHSLIHFKKSHLQGFPVKQVLVLQSIFFVTVLASVYSVNPSDVFKEWEKQLAILLFPLLLAVTPLDLRQYKINFLAAFALSCTLTIIYLDIDALRIINYKHLPFSALFSDAFINHNFSDSIDIHPTYLSMYVALSIVFMLSFLFSRQSFALKLFACFCMALLSVSLIQLGSKSVLIAFLFLMLLSPLFLGQRMKRKIVFLPALIFAVAMITIFQFSSLRNRFISTLVEDVTRADIGVTKNEYRIVRWLAAVDLIKQSPVVGFGTASEIKLLKKKYFERRLYNSFINELNAHNQYLSQMIKAGIIGLIVFLYSLCYGFAKAIQRKDFVMFSFLVIVATVSVSENILEVNKGIFYYSFFFSLFVLALSKERDISALKSNRWSRKDVFIIRTDRYYAMNSLNKIVTNYAM